jgi:hypothetical protein
VIGKILLNNNLYLKLNIRNMDELFNKINWNLVIWALLLLVFAYSINSLRQVGSDQNQSSGSNDTPLVPQRDIFAHLGINLWSVLSLMAILTSIFIILPEFFPYFWSNVRSSEVFWPMLILLIFSAYMWRSRYYGNWGLFFFVLLGLILYKFGNIKF